MTWLALRTEPGRLPIVRRLLKRAGNDCYLPAEIRLNHRRRKRIVVPMMPYLFVKSPAPELQALWMQQIKGVRYVKGFVATNPINGPCHIADAKIEVLRRSIADYRNVERGRKALNQLRKGSRATVKNGPLAGRKGTVSWVNGDRAKLEAFIFGSLRTVTIETSQLEAA